MGQTWESLLFAHWRVPVAEVRRRVPRALSVDVIDGSGWVAITPFVLRGLRLRGAPPVRGISAFPELNVRTYVTVDGKPGIYFFSLDAGSRLAVAGARATYGLPYHRARMRVAARGSAVEYSSRRIVGRGTRSAVLSARYEPVGEAATPAPGTLEHQLTERYCLYAVDRAGRVHRGEIHHPPWRLQPARVDIWQNSMGDPIGLDLPGRPVLGHFSSRQDVVVWPPARVPAERPGD